MEKTFKAFCKEFGFDGRTADSKERYQVYLKTGKVKKKKNKKSTGPDNQNIICGSRNAIV